MFLLSWISEACTQENTYKAVWYLVYYDDNWKSLILWLLNSEAGNITLLVQPTFMSLRQWQIVCCPVLLILLVESNECFYSLIFIFHHCSSSRQFNSCKRAAAVLYRSSCKCQSPANFPVRTERRHNIEAKVQFFLFQFSFWKTSTDHPYGNLHVLHACPVISIFVTK